MAYLDSAGLLYLWGKLRPRLPVVINNKTVPASAFATDNTYGDYPYGAVIACSGVSADMTAAVTFALDDAESGNFAPVCAAGSGTVTIYAQRVPETETVIPSIIAVR